MDGYDCGVPRKTWELPFLAEPEELADLRDILRIHLRLWGLPEQIDTAQVCLSELVANVITHVGVGTPTTLSVSMSGTYLRIEVHDPDTRATPTLIQAGPDCESGRGMAMVNALADRWGVHLYADRKVTWCEIATGDSPEHRDTWNVRMVRAEAVISHYGAANFPRIPGPTPLAIAVAEEAVIDVFIDLLHWLRARGCDPDGALDSAQMQFEAEVSGAA